LICSIIHRKESSKHVQQYIVYYIYIENIIIVSNIFFFILLGDDYITLCKGEDRPTEGVLRRLPIYPWWYYSCEGTKVKCQPCQSTGDLDKPTLFFSERCQQCISEYKGKRVQNQYDITILILFNKYS